MALFDAFRKKPKLGTAYVTPAEASAMKNPSISTTTVAPQTKAIDVAPKANVQDYVARGGGGSSSGGSAPIQTVSPTPKPTPTQPATSPKPATDYVVEKISKDGSVEQRLFYANNKLAFTEDNAAQRQGHIDKFTIQKNKAGRTVGLIEERTANARTESLRTGELPANTYVSTQSVSDTDRSSFGRKIINRAKTSNTYSSFLSGAMEDAKVSFPNLDKNIGKAKDYVISKAGFGIPGTPYFVPISAIPTDKVTNLYGDFQNWKSEDRSIKVGGTNLYYNRGPEWFESPRGQMFTQSTELLFTAAMVTPAGIGRQVIVETVPLRQKQAAYATELIETKIVNKVPVRQAEYTIFTEIKPPRVRITTTLNRASMGKKPLEVKYFNSIMQKTTTPFQAVADQPFITFTGKSSKTVQASQVSAASERIEIGSYPNQLSQNQRYLVEQMARSKADNAPVLQEIVPKLFNKNNLYFSSNIQVEQLATLKPYNKNLKYNIYTRKIPGKNTYGGAFKDKRPLEVSSLTKGGEGTATTRYEALTEVKLLGETDLYEYSTSKILFKDITYPNAKAAGNTPELTVFTTEKKMLNVDDLTNDVVVNRLYSNKKTPFATTFQVEKAKLVFPKSPPPPTPKAIVSYRTISPSKLTPQTFTATSLYAGTGLYERSSGGSLPGVNLPGRTDQSLYPTSVTPQSYSTSNAMKDFTLTKPVTTLVSSPQYRTISKPMTKNITKDINKEITKPITKDITKNIQKPMSKIIQKPMQKLLQKPMQKPMLFVTPARPGTPPPKGVFGFLKLRGKKQKSGFGNYKVSLRRFGIFKPIGFAKSQRQAFDLGTQAAGRTLGATFKVEGKGIKYPKKIKGFKTKLTKEGTLYIEQPKYRLSKSTEVKEIQLFKKRKGGKKK
jgi:hypothetical protein